MLRAVVVLLAVSVAVASSLPSSVSVQGFGRNVDGVLGASKDSLVTPEVIDSLDSQCVAQGDLGSNRAVFVTCDGRVLLMGANVGPTGEFSLSEAVHQSKPVVVEKLRKEKAVMAAVGTHHTIVLTDKGRVFAWGENRDGQLGFGGSSVLVSPEPVEILTLSHKNVRMVSAGGNRSAALTDDGKLYMWGLGAQGEMGDGSTKSHRHPTLVQSLNNNGQRVCQVAIGGSHVAAVTNAGDLYTWGNGNSGQLGHGEFGIQKKRPSHVTRLRRNVCHLSAGHDFTSAVTQDERVFLWGSDGYPAPFEKTWFQGRAPRQTGNGNAHMVVLLANGSVATWGSRKQGEAGREFQGDFTLEPGFVDAHGVSQLVVGHFSTFLLGGSPPAVSLCPCLHNHFAYWRNEVTFTPTCTEEQVECGDGSCCAEGHTCCASGEGGAESVVVARSVDSTPTASKNFKCVKGNDATCCDGFGCESGFKCWGTPQCVPSWAHKGMSVEDLAERSSDPLPMKAFASSPGSDSQAGVCGVRKTTCPDDTCCSQGATCCPKPDGSYGCCQHQQATCCANGCCREGFTCDDNHNTCVKKETGSTAVQLKVEGQCGNNKVQCPDRSCCGEGKSCCMLNDGYFGCCPFANGICCADGAGCCPQSHTCDVKNNQCILANRGEFGEDQNNEVVAIPMRATPGNSPQRSPVGEVKCDDDTVCQYPGTCCSNNGKSTCCDFINGTCCEGGLGCCPGGYTCDLANSKCSPLSGGTKKYNVPMKFNRDAKPAGNNAKKKATCPGKTPCGDNNCCPLGSSCCKDKNGDTTCCSSMTAVCCEDGGCCSEGDRCDALSHGCVASNGDKYGFLSSQNPSQAHPEKQARDVVAPGKCFADERICESGMCCPRSATCCSGPFGQSGCCPASHAICCANGGCCPGGSTCDAENLECTAEGKEPTKMLMSDSSHSPESEWDVEECWEDETTCAVDGGCCLKTETCCNVHTDEGVISACCPFENGICCDGGNGCCPSDSECDVEGGGCKKIGEDDVVPFSANRGSAVHPLAGLSEIDCPDGSVCGGSDTCCSLGFDEYWGEEIYACCPFENAVCCSEFEGCCPNGFACDSDTKGCVSEGRDLPASDSSPADPSPTYVCAFPDVQCPSGRCCGEGEQCARTDQGSFRCVVQGHVVCGNGSHACPNGTWCDKRNDRWMCSLEMDNLPEVKETLLKEYWGDDAEAACASMLIQEGSSTSQDSPPVVVTRPPKQLWFPKRLVVQQRAIPTVATSLPTLLAAKVCQHLNASGTPQERCFISNSNGHFAVQERPLVQNLVAEYSRRLCEQHTCEAPQGETYVFDSEELNPCPCREKPSKGENQTEVADPEITAGSSDSKEEEVIDVVAEKESQQSDESAPMSADSQGQIADEKPITKAPMGGAASGTEPVVAEEAPLMGLVAPNSDAMKRARSIEVESHAGDQEMLAAHRPETFMGKEACDDKEDNAESAVDLDGETAVLLDQQSSDSDDRFGQVSLAQMNAKAEGTGALMPEM